MYDASVPVFKQMLGSLSVVLNKAQEHAEHKNIDPSTLLQARLFADMFHLIRQVQIATDFAKGVTARLAGIDVPVYEDNETSFDGLQKRIAKTIEFLSSVPANKIVGSEQRDITTQAGTPKERKFTGQAYLLNYGLPQFFFHVNAAYGILRHEGVEIGKRDYMGAF